MHVPFIQWHLKSTLIRTGVHVDEAVMGRDSQYTRTETERATTPYYYDVRLIPSYLK